LMFLVQKRFKYISLEAGIGWQTRDYDSRTLDDGDELIYKAGVTWENPPPPDGRRNLGKVFVRARNHAHLGFESGYSTLGDAYRIDRFTLSLDHVIRDRIILRARGIYEMDDYNASTREDDYYDVNGVVGYLWKENLELNLTVGREENDSNFNNEDYVNNYVLLAVDFNFEIGSRGGFSKESRYY
ncbi:MAG: outer membrane beta-barrel protein, partial [Desulfobacterales bacterium]|nr:outer membrane beta-barrel protein [Desulfobacterales bacterium]